MAIHQIILYQDPKNNRLALFAIKSLGFLRTHEIKAYLPLYLPKVSCIVEKGKMALAGNNPGHGSYGLVEAKMKV